MVASRFAHAAFILFVNEGMLCSFRQRILKSLVLFAAQTDAPRILARHHRNAKPDIIAGANLVHKPTHAMGFVGFVAGHNVQLVKIHFARLGDRACQRLVLYLVIAVWNIARICRLAPRAFLALAKALQLPHPESTFHAGQHMRSGNALQME